MTTKPPLRDLKEGLSSARKPDITHVRTPFLNYTARSCEFGNFKYERANYARPVSPTPGTPAAADFQRFRAYLRAAASHIFHVLDAMEMHQSQDPELLDVEGMKRAAFAVDTDVTPGSKTGPSLLPHVAPACASLNMAITQAVNAGLLPADPGQTWVEKPPTAKDDPVMKREQVRAFVQSRGAYLRNEDAPMHCDIYHVTHSEFGSK